MGFYFQCKKMTYELAKVVEVIKFLAQVDDPNLEKFLVKFMQ